MRRSTLLLAASVLCWPAAASALTVRDVLELTRAGVGDDVLLALIEVDPSVFPIDAPTLTSLKAAGVSERVIVAMVRSGRPQAPPAGAADATTAASAVRDPQVVIIEHHDQAPPVREVPVAVPVYIPIPVERHHRVDVSSEDADGVSKRPARPEPVYWGWGGRLRPDAWQPK